MFGVEITIQNSYEIMVSWLRLDEEYFFLVTSKTLLCHRCPSKVVYGSADQALNAQLPSNTHNNTAGT